MNRIENVFDNQKDLLNIFITAGYPQINSLPKLAKELINQGVDIIEIGMPYSDPLADGPIIQNASSIALSNGITLSNIFEQVAEIRKASETIPLILMGYFNQLLQMGVEQFLSKCKESGVDGLIIPDLPVEVYTSKYQDLFNKYEISISFLITPQTTNARINLLDKACSSFLYIVSDNSLTGAKNDGFTEEQITYFQRIKKCNLNSPTMIGFGISSNNMVRQANNYANGAIIGSAYLEAIRIGKDTEFIKILTS